jgi:hypothetical protein
MTGIHPEIHKQVYSFLETELGIKKKDLKLPLENVSRPSEATIENKSHSRDALMKRSSEATVRERAEKYKI